MIRAEIVHTVNMVMADTAHVTMVHTVNNLTGKLWKQWESCNQPISCYNNNRKHNVLTVLCQAKFKALHLN